MEPGIVVGVDETGSGAAAVQWAVREALLRRLPLVAARSWMPSQTYAYGAAGYLVSGGDQLEAETCAAEQLKLAGELLPGSDALRGRSVAVMGSPAQVLLGLSRHGELLVVGTRGAGALSRLVLGSVSSAVLHHAHGVVVVVPELPVPAGPPERVVVGYDHSPGATHAVGVAAEMARRYRCRLVLAHVREQLWVEGGRGSLDDVDAGAGLLSQPAVRSAVQAAGLDVGDVDAVVAPGQAAATLTAMVTDRDVLVLGSRGRGGFTGLLLGSTSTQCAQHAVCPVVVVHDTDPQAT